MSVGEFNKNYMAKLQVLLGERGRDNPSAAVLKGDIKALQSAINRVNITLSNENKNIPIVLPANTKITVIGDVATRSTWQVVTSAATMGLADYRLDSGGQPENPLIFSAIGRVQTDGGYMTKLCIGVVNREVGDADWLTGNAIGRVISLSAGIENTFSVAFADNTSIFDDAPGIPREWALFVARPLQTLPLDIASLTATIGQVNR